MAKMSNSNKAMGKSTFWGDIDNSPHVVFFKPIIKRLNKYGNKGCEMDY